jgi:ubiquinone/menaquinone biosynthesis C-methylase UbiE
MGDFDMVTGYDRGMRPLEWLILRRIRRRIFPGLRGVVLEVGVGTGVNLPLYRAGARVVAVDSSTRMLARAAQRPWRAAVALVCADVQHLPFRRDAFDTVSGALVFCSVAVPERGLSEARRVLRETGRLVLLEHTRGRGPGAWLTDLLQPLWGIWSSECRLNRETVETIVGTGFRVLAVDHYLLGIVRSVVASAAD